jgi:MFS transporter, PHS family, inorganic phosphate transporter
MGKLGAIVGVAAFVPVVDTYGIDVAFFSCAVISILGLICTIFLIPETKGTSFDVMDEQEANDADAIEEQDERRPLAGSRAD